MLKFTVLIFIDLDILEERTRCPVFNVNRELENTGLHFIFTKLNLVFEHLLNAEVKMSVFQFRGTGKKYQIKFPYQ